MIRQKNKILFICILLGYIPSLLLGQINIQGKLSAVNKQSPIHLSIYANDAHQVKHYQVGEQFKCNVPRYEECLLVFYQEKSASHIISINTFEQTKAPIRLNVHLQKLNNEDKTGLHKGPAKRIRIVNNQPYFSKFDLDEVKDKGSYAAVMGDASDDLHQFYKTGQIPKEKISHSSNLSEAALRKSEHRLGQEVYILLKKKGAIERKIANHQTKVIPQKEEGACAHELEQLKLETALAKYSYELSDKQLQKEKLRIRRLESKGEFPNLKKVKNGEHTFKKLTKLYEIATLNLKNKQADCWELKLQNELNTEQTGRNATHEIQIKSLGIEAVRLQKRLENARVLYRQHNDLASDLTGRDRIVQLANAQKFISEQEEVKYYRLENELKQWQYKEARGKQYKKQIADVKKQLTLQYEIAWQAEMGYLEHMWHLRNKMTDDINFANELYKRQTGLLALKPFRKDPKKEDEPAKNDVDQTLFSSLKVATRNGEEGTIKTLQFDNTDSYEIIIHSNGKRSYSKNGKPISKLTYAFETKRKFGEITENVRAEEERKRLGDLFKKKID